MSISAARRRHYKGNEEINMPPVCDTPECSQALARLQAARNAILSLCSQLTQRRASAATLDSLMKGMFVAAASLLALALAALNIPILGWIWAAGFFAGAALFASLGLYCLARLGVINGQITALEEELVAAREEFDKAVAEVTANCPVECWGVLDQPTCP